MSVQIPDTPFPATKLYERVQDEKLDVEELHSIYLDCDGSGITAVARFVSSTPPQTENPNGIDIEFSEREVTVEITSEELLERIRETITMFSNSWTINDDTEFSYEDQARIEYTHGLWRIQTIIRLERKSTGWQRDCQELLADTSPLVIDVDELHTFRVRIAHEGVENQFDYTVWVETEEPHEVSGHTSLTEYAESKAEASDYTVPEVKDWDSYHLHSHLPTNTTTLDSWFQDFLENQPQVITTDDATKIHPYEFITGFDTYELLYSITQAIGALPDVPDADSQLSSQ